MIIGGMTIRQTLAILSVAGLTACELPELPSWAELPSWPDLPSFSFGGEGPEESSSNECVAGSEKNYRALDWAGAKHTDIYNRKGKLVPSTVVLKSGTPNIIRLYNAGRGAWSFRAEEFFRAAAVVSVLYGGQTIFEPCLEAIKIGALKWAEIKIVPLRQGEFSFSGGGEVAFTLSFSTPSETGKIIVR